MDLSAIMTMDFEDDGLGENEFKKMKEKKSSVDLSKFVLDDTLSDAARNKILMQTGTHIQLICAFSSLARIAINEIVPEGERTPAQMREVVSENWASDVQDLFDTAVACVTDTATDDDIVRRAVGSAMTVAQYMALHPVSSGGTNEAAVGRVATQFMRLALAVLSRTSEVSTGTPARRMSSPRSPPKSADLHKPTSSGGSAAELAREALPQLMCFVPAGSMLALAVPMCQMMADVSRSDDNRRVATEILGSIVHAGTLSDLQIEELLLPLVLQLCQDVSADVRESMSLQLNYIIRSLSTPRLVDQVLPDMLELLDDEKQQVRYAVIITAIDMVPVLPKDYFARKVLPKFLDMANEVIDGGESFPTFPPELPLKFGLMFHSIFSQGSFWEDVASRNTDMSVFLQCYEKLAASANEKTRKKCCFNYPAVLQTVGKEGFGDHVLRSILFQFVQDPSIEVRRLVATFLHELCAILSVEQCTVHVFDALQTLLQDKEARVWSALFGHLDCILNTFCGGDAASSSSASVSTETQQLLYQELLPLITSCIKTDRRAWRSQVTLVSQIERFPLHFNHAALTRSVVPPLMKILECSNIPLQKVACRVLCSIGRQCPETRSHEDMIRRFDNHFSCSESCTFRKTFLLICEEILRTHSRRFGREVVLPIVISMLDDLVADVQRRALQLVPALWNVLRLKVDKELMTALLERLDLTAKSPRRYLSATAKEVQVELDSLMGGSGEHASSAAGGGSIKISDKVLEEEEAKLGHFRKQAAATAGGVVDQAAYKLKQGNKELHRAQKVNAEHASSSDEGVYVTTSSSSRRAEEFRGGSRSSSTVGRAGRKADGILQLSPPGGGGSRGGGGGLQKKIPKKPMALPRHPDTLPNLKNNNASLSNSPGLMSGKTKVVGKAKRRPPGVAKVGKSPRSGKNLRAKPKGIKKKKPPVAK